MSIGDCLKEALYTCFPFLLNFLYPRDKEQEARLDALEAQNIAVGFVPPIDNGLERLQEVRLAYERSALRLESVQAKAKDYLMFSGALLTAFVTLVAAAVATTTTSGKAKVLTLLEGWQAPKICFLIAIIYLLAAVWFCMRTLEKGRHYSIGEDEVVSSKDNINLLVQAYIEVNYRNHNPINSKVDYFETAHRCLVNSFLFLFASLIILLVLL